MRRGRRSKKTTPSKPTPHGTDMYNVCNVCDVYDVHSVCNVYDEP